MVPPETPGTASALPIATPFRYNAAHSRRPAMASYALAPSLVVASTPVASAMTVAESTVAVSLPDPSPPSAPLPSIEHSGSPLGAVDDFLREFDRRRRVVRADDLTFGHFDLPDALGRGEASSVVCAVVMLYGPVARTLVFVYPFSGPNSS